MMINLPLKSILVGIHRDYPRISLTPAEISIEDYLVLVVLNKSLLNCTIRTLLTIFMNTMNVNNMMTGQEGEIWPVNLITTISFLSRII